MRRGWVRWAVPTVVVLGGLAVGAGVRHLTADDGCTRTGWNYQGAGVWASADEALAHFLAEGADDSPAEDLSVDELSAVETDSEHVVFQTADRGVDVVASRTGTGWFVTEASGTC